MFLCFYHYFSSVCSFCGIICYSLSFPLFLNHPFTFLLFVSQIMSITVPGQVGGLTALNILHKIFVFSKALMQALPDFCCSEFSILFVSGFCDWHY